MKEAFAKNKVLSLIVVILLLTNILLLVLFIGKQPGFHPMDGTRGKPGGGWNTMELLEKQVGFSKEQLTRYKSLKDAHWESMKPYFADIKVARDRFFRLMDMSIPDSLTLAYADSIAIKQKEIDLRTLRHFREVRAICTDEQRPRYDSVMNDIMRKMNNPMRKIMRADSIRRADSLRMLNK